MTLDGAIQSLGLPGIVIGTVLEGEGVAFLGGILAHRGLFGFEAIALAAALGAAIADNAMFLTGRYAGKSALARRVLSRPAVDRLRLNFQSRPELAVLGLRFIYGLKTVGAALAGTTRMTWRRFALLDALAVLLWAHVFCGVGYVAGTAIEAAFGRLRLPHHLMLAVLAGGVLVILSWRVAVRLRRPDRA